MVVSLLLLGLCFLVDPLCVCVCVCVCRGEGVAVHLSSFPGFQMECFIGIVTGHSQGFS